MALEDLNDFVKWFFVDVARRLDSEGNKLPRSRRHFKDGRPVLIHSRRIFNPDLPEDVWGICYPPGDNRVFRGSDLLWKLALSVHAYQSEGMGITEACATLLDSEHDRVREQTGYEGTEEGVHRLRVRVTRYLQRFKVDRALIDAEFGRWFNYFKWQQRKKLSDQQWYEEVESEFQARICIAQRELRATHWQTGECRLALAGIYHEQAKYSQATECYTKARQELGRASVTKGFRSDLADWIDGQIDNCSEGLPPTPVPTWDPASGKLLPVRQIGQLEAT